MTTINFNELSTDLIGKKVLIRGRVEAMRVQKNLIFLILRKQLQTVQVVAIKSQVRDSFEALSKVPAESIIDVIGKVNPPPNSIEATTFENIEIELHEWKPVSIAESLPFSVIDANGSGTNNVDLVTRLESPWINYRAPFNLAIQRIQYGVCLLFRKFLNKEGFQEIHTPKLIGFSSEGGSEVFPVKYFDKDAFLAQSPQLYKQMMINSDFRRVYEVGPVFRAENSFSGRHMCEFTGLDLEMEIDPGKDHYQILHLIWNLLTFIFDRLKIRFPNEHKCIREKHPFNNPIYPKEPLIIQFSECISMLKESGIYQEELEDLSSENERKLGELVKAKFGSDLFILEKYPTKVRPFYTMQCEDPNYTRSYDIIFKCQEISSGSRRINDYATLIKSVTEKGINADTIKFYLDSFRHGSYPHGGCGLGLERIVNLYLELGNIRRASLFPRDPKRLTP